MTTWLIVGYLAVAYCMFNALPDGLSWGIVVSMCLCWPAVTVTALFRKLLND